MRRIDVHAHAFPEFYLRAVAQRYPNDVRLGSSASGRLIAIWAGAPIPAWDATLRLAEMERDGVEVEMLSAPVVHTWNDDETPTFCRELNDFQAEVAAAHPGRFRSFLHLPVHRIDESLAELERWKGRREVAGVVFGSNMAGLYPGARELAPLWEAIAASELPVFVHPTKPAACFGPIAPPLVLFPCDTAIAAASIIYSGSFLRWPALKIILSHYGGVLPLVALRLDMAVEVPGFPPGHGQDLPEPPSTYVRRFYADTAQGYFAPALRCALEVYGPDKILYGSDHFFEDSSWRPRLNAFLAEAALAPDELAAIVRHNALRVLP